MIFSLSSCLSFFHEFFKCQLRNGCYVLKFQIYNKLRFLLCRGSSVVCVFYDTQWLLWVHAGFILSLETTLLIRSYMQTGAIDGTHSQQTECPYSPTTTQMYRSFVLGKTTGSSGPKAPALIVLSDRVSLLLDVCPVIRPNPRLSAPAAQVAEWLHYKPGVPDE